MEPRREGSKLRLKRKRQEEENGQEREALRSSPAWFRKQDLSSAERRWATLLMAVEPALDCSRLDKMADLPPFLPKSFAPANPRPSPEHFNVGTTPFEWVPFPPYSRENIPGKGSRSHEKETVDLVASENNEEGSSKARVLEKMSLAATYGQTVEGSTMQQSVRHSTKLEEEERMERDGSIQRQDSSGPSASMAAQSHAKRMDFQRLDDGPATQGKQDKKEEALDEDALRPSGLPAQGPLPANFAEPEKAENSSEGFPNLDQCPMCQMPFTGTWSRLDLDSHLAQCLSESTEDVVW
ncbi:hypothetical protein JRQ81_009790 [Phrynocephalus forsythii]|uniref:UBZ2-type domain-containing protein n=1 Tax=Phrynocephalus forsythii TaxID=171643 RepID=A0A9Q0XAU7_9SAUR|nr:hypothetical protein JRQ81_009790 [Phrynocephalus forsythii]